MLIALNCTLFTDRWRGLCPRDDAKGQHIIRTSSMNARSDCKNLVVLEQILSIWVIMFICSLFIEL